MKQFYNEAYNSHKTRVGHNAPMNEVWTSTCAKLFNWETQNRSWREWIQSLSLTLGQPGSASRAYSKRKGSFLCRRVSNLYKQCNNDFYFSYVVSLRLYRYLGMWWETFRARFKLPNIMMMKIIKTHTKLKKPSLKNTTDLHLDYGKIQHIRFCMDLTLFYTKNWRA